MRPIAFLSRRRNSNFAPGARPPVAFIAWSTSGRAADFAATLGGEARTYYDLEIVRPGLIPVRYLISSLRMTAYLLFRRPRSLIVSAPPVFPGLIGLFYSIVVRVPVVIDAHPASFGLKGDRVTRLLLPLQKFASRRATANLVTVPELAHRIESWGGRALIIHEAPPTATATPAPDLPARPRVLFVTIFEPDEPVDIVLQAGALLPEMDVFVTGDRRKASPTIFDGAPSNVVFTGFLRGDDYYRALETANVVISLTDRTQTVSRVGYETVYLQRPLVISDTSAARRTFPDAVFVDNTAEDLARGIRSVIERYNDVREALGKTAEAQAERWDGQLRALKSSLWGGDLPGPAVSGTPATAQDTIP